MTETAAPPAKGAKLGERLMNAGLLRLAEGRVEEAAALFSRAAELSPGSAAPRVNLAAAQARLGRLGDAEETLSAARARFPGHPDVLYQLGTVYERTGDRERCADAYSAFLAASVPSTRYPGLTRGIPRPQNDLKHSVFPPGQGKMVRVHRCPATVTGNEIREDATARASSSKPGGKARKVGRRP